MIIRPNSRRLKMLSKQIQGGNWPLSVLDMAPKNSIVVNVDDIHFSFISLLKQRQRRAEKKWFQFDYVLSFQVHYMLFMVVWSIFFLVYIAHLRANNITSNQTKANRNTSFQ